MRRCSADCDQPGAEVQSQDLATEEVHTEQSVNTSGAGGSEWDRTEKPIR